MGVLGDGETKKRPKMMMRVIETQFEVTEKRQYDGESGPTVIVFRPGSRKT
jgi:hypothetical protein